MIKKSKVKKVKSVSEPWGDRKILYHKLEMENGDKIDIGKLTKQEVGSELSYNIIGDIGQQPFTKAKSVAPEGFKGNNFSGGFKQNPETQERITRWAGLGRAIDYLHGTQPTEEQLYQQAERFIDWVMEDKKPNENNEITF